MCFFKGDKEIFEAIVSTHCPKAGKQTTSAARAWCPSAHGPGSVVTRRQGACRRLGISSHANALVLGTRHGREWANSITEIPGIWRSYLPGSSWKWPKAVEDCDLASEASRFRTRDFDCIGEGIRHKPATERNRPRKRGKENRGYRRLLFCGNLSLFDYFLSVTFT